MSESEYNKMLLHFENEVLAKYTPSPYKTVSCSDNIEEYDNVVDVSTLNSILSEIKVLTENGCAYKIVNYYPNLNGKVKIRVSYKDAMVGIVTTKGKVYRFLALQKEPELKKEKENNEQQN